MLLLLMVASVPVIGIAGANAVTAAGLDAAAQRLAWFAPLLAQLFPDELTASAGLIEYHSIASRRRGAATPRSELIKNGVARSNKVDVSRLCRGGQERRRQRYGQAGERHTAQ